VRRDEMLAHRSDAPRPGREIGVDGAGPMLRDYREVESPVAPRADVQRRLFVPGAVHRRLAVVSHTLPFSAIAALAVITASRTSRIAAL